MEKQKGQVSAQVTDFTEQTPKNQIGREPVSRLYEAAFLNRNEKNDCEYCLNTTAWD